MSSLLIYMVRIMTQEFVSLANDSILALKLQNINMTKIDGNILDTSKSYLSHLH